MGCKKEIDMKHNSIVILPKGTIVKIEGLPYCLVEDTQVVRNTIAKMVLAWVNSLNSSKNRKMVVFRPETVSGSASLK